MTELPGEPVLPEEVLLTPEETAQALNCTLADLQRNRSRHEGPAYLDFGDGLIRYPRAGIEQAIARRHQDHSAAQQEA